MGKGGARGLSPCWLWVVVGCGLSPIVYCGLSPTKWGREGLVGLWVVGCHRLCWLVLGWVTGKERREWERVWAGGERKKMEVR